MNARAAIEIALATAALGYDSLYIALAMHEGCRFVTADERLVNGLGGTPLWSALGMARDDVTGAGRNLDGVLLARSEGSPRTNLPMQVHEL